jgi:hypothetical protein
MTKSLSSHRRPTTLAQAFVFPGCKMQSYVDGGECTTSVKVLHHWISLSLPRPEPMGGVCQVACNVFDSDSGVVPYCKNCVNSKWPGLAPRPITRSMNPVSSGLTFGARDVGGALQIKLACWMGNSEGCGRPTCTRPISVAQRVRTFVERSGYSPPARLIISSCPMNLMMSFKGDGCRALLLALMWCERSGGMLLLLSSRMM